MPNLEVRYEKRQDADLLIPIKHCRVRIVEKKSKQVHAVSRRPTTDSHSEKVDCEKAETEEILWTDGTKTRMIDFWTPNRKSFGHWFISTIVNFTARSWRVIAPNLGRAKIDSLPGSKLQSILKFIVPSKTFKQVFEPTFSDWQVDYVDALADKELSPKARAWKARFVWYRGYAIIAMTISFGPLLSRSLRSWLLSLVNLIRVIASKVTDYRC